MKNFEFQNGNNEEKKKKGKSTSSTQKSHTHLPSISRNNVIYPGIQSRREAQQIRLPAVFKTFEKQES